MSCTISSWVHCTFCMSLAREKEFKMGITRCGRVICQDCVVKLEETNWVECCGVCNGAIALNYRAPEMVVNLFQDVPKQIKTISTIVTFQEKQKQSFRNHLREKKNKLRSKIIEQDLKIFKLKTMLEQKKLELDKVKQQSSFHKATLDSIAAGLNNPNPRKELRVSWKLDSSVNRKLAGNPGLHFQSRERFGGSRIEEQTLGTSVRGKDSEVKWKNPRTNSLQQVQARNIGATSFLTSSPKVRNKDQFPWKGGHLGMFGGHHQYQWNVGQFNRDGDQLERRGSYLENNDGQSRQNNGPLQQNWSQLGRNIGHLEKDGSRSGRKISWLEQNIGHLGQTSGHSARNNGLRRVNNGQSGMNNDHFRQNGSQLGRNSSHLEQKSRQSEWNIGQSGHYIGHLKWNGGASGVKY